MREPVEIKRKASIKNSLNVPYSKLQNYLNDEKEFLQDKKIIFYCAIGERSSLAIQIAKSYNYDEINLNVGCPSKAVQKGSFGACLMKKKSLVKNCLEQMKNAADIEVSVKCRIGIGKEFNYDFFSDFINEIIKSDISIVYVHARNAILNGISPKANRNIPPLNYDFVKKIKLEYPKIQFILNGGIENLEHAYKLSNEYDGVMVGRLIQNNPFCLSKIDKLFFNYSEK